MSRKDVFHICYHIQVYFVFKSHFLVPPTSLTSGIDRIEDIQLHMWLACEMLLGVGVYLKLCGTKMLLGYFLLFSGFTFLKSQSAMNVVTDLHSMRFLYGLWHLTERFSLWNLHIGISNPLQPELIPTCYLLALLGAHHFLHVSRIRVKSLTFRRLMS